MPGLENRGWNYLEERFGVEKEDVENYRLREQSGDLWLVSSDLETDLEVEVYGIRLLRHTGMGLKPTTYGLQLIEDHIRKNIISMTREETLKMLRKEEMIERDLESEGYMALEFDGRIIGCGFYRDGVVSSRIPEARGEELAGILDQ